MTATADAAMLMKAIIAAPDDDLARLAYADVMEELGDTARAAFIRDQVAGKAATIPYSVLAADAEGLLGFQPHKMTRSANQDYSTADAWDAPGLTEVALVEYRRGLIHAARCCLGPWLNHGPKLAALNPIASVRLNDKYPSANHGWFRNPANVTSHWLPPEIFRLLPGVYPSLYWQYHKSAKDAEDALSQALILWARSKIESTFDPSHEPRVPS